ncbi:hypothetical protein AGMMS49992_22080 [Clostridia bacterium]|nr:hypothetical protein AGMMS49992_22080 [Clostridia bacterium]
MTKITTVNPTYASLLDDMLNRCMTLSQVAEMSGVSNTRLHLAFFCGMSLTDFELRAVRSAVYHPELASA